MSDNRTDNISEVFVLDAIEQQKKAAMGHVDDWINFITEASKKSRISEVFVGDSGNLFKMTEGITKATEATNAHTTATKNLFEAKKQELDLAIRQSVIDSNNAKAKRDEAAASNEQTQETIALTKEKERLRKEQEKEEANAKRLQGEYAELKKKYNDAAKEALNLGARVGATNKEFLDAAANVKKMHDELYTLESAIGRSQRNVGNYSSAWNGLGNSVNQLTRDLPAFANSVQTGFMAISNNIPIVIDEINRLKVKNEELAASGAATTPIWKQVAASVFSWQTAMSAAITLVVVYGKDIIDFFTGSGEEAKKQAKNIDSFTQSMQNLQKAASGIDEDLQNQYQREIAKMGAQGASEEKLTAKTMEEIDKRYIANQKYLQKLNKEREEAVAYGKKLIDDEADDEVYNKQLEVVKQIDAEIARTKSKSAQLTTQYITTFYNEQKKVNDKANTESLKDYEKTLELRNKITIALRKQLEDDLNAHKGPDDVDDMGYNKSTEKSLQILLDKYKEYDAEKSGLFADSEHYTSQLSKKEADMLNVMLELVLKRNKTQRDEEKKTADEKKKHIQEEIQAWTDLERVATKVITAISAAHQAASNKKIAALEKDKEQADITRDRELAALDKNILGNQKYDEKKAEIEARAAQRKQLIAQQEANTQAKEEQFQKQMAIFQATLSLYVGIAKEIEKGGVIGIASGAAIGVYMAGVIAALAGSETPSYGDGTPPEGHHGGDAIIGEKKLPTGYQPERVTLPNSKSFITSGPMYVKNMPKGTKVEPLDEIQAAANAIAMQTGLPVLPHYNDGGSQTVMTDGFDRMIDAFHNRPEHHWHLKNGELVDTVYQGGKQITYHNANNG